MINFCTLFDSNYLTRGLALYESLCRVCPAFQLYIIAFDDNCFEYLSESKLPFLTPITLRDFEDKELLGIKSTRTAAEYCWTCTPSVILYCLQKFSLPSCTYLDADMIFYQDPQILLNEVGTDSVLITEHRYTREYNVALTHGIYCVQFVYFKNDDAGLSILRWWRDRCLEWCYNYREDNKFGDQKYLDDWTTRFKGVHVLQHPGGGVAPWNVQQYSFEGRNGKIYLSAEGSSMSYPLVFFHFHGLKFYSNQMVSCTATLYEISMKVKEILYFPYITELLAIEKDLKQSGIHFNPNGARIIAPDKWKVFFYFIKERLWLVAKRRISPLNLRKFDFTAYYHFYRFSQFKLIKDGIPY
jgi:hypothetical protein